MLPYIVYQDTKLRTDELNRRAEIYRMISDARRERRANRQLSALRFRRTVPAVPAADCQG
jgi:hypothetical protein